MHWSATTASSVPSLRCKRCVSSYSSLFSIATWWGELSSCPHQPGHHLAVGSRKQGGGGKNSVNRDVVFCNISLPTPHVYSSWKVLRCWLKTPTALSFSLPVKNPPGMKQLRLFLGFSKETHCFTLPVRRIMGLGVWFVLIKDWTGALGTTETEWIILSTQVWMVSKWEETISMKKNPLRRHSDQLWLRKSLKVKIVEGWNQYLREKHQEDTHPFLVPLDIHLKPRASKTFVLVQFGGEDLENGWYFNKLGLNAVWHPLKKKKKSGGFWMNNSQKRVEHWRCIYNLLWTFSWANW